MRNIIYLLLAFNALLTHAQRQKEIKDFPEKWKLESVQMERLFISGLPGKVKVIGNDEGFLDIKVTGKDVQFLTGGATGLGFILSKDRKNNFRIQGLSDQRFDVEFIISIPNKAKLHMGFGNQKDESKSWTIENLKGDIYVEKYLGNLALVNVSGSVSTVNHGGDASIAYASIKNADPHMISVLGNITLDLPKSAQANLELHLQKDTFIELEGETPSSFNKKGSFNLQRGKHTLTLNSGEALIKVYCYQDQLTLKFH